MTPKAKPKAEGNALILVLNGEPPALSSTLRQVSKTLNQAKIKASLILICPPAQAEKLSRLPVLRGLKAQILAKEGALSSDWNGLVEAALASKAKWLLFFPGGAVPSAETIRSLFNSSSKYQWIFSRRGQAPQWLDSLVQWLLHVPAMDLGSACLVQRKTVLNLGLRYGSGETLVGLRLFHAAFASGVSVAEIPSRSKAPLTFMEALGLNQAQGMREILKRVEGLVASSALIAVGLSFPKPAVLALTLFGFGFLGLGYFIGKPE